MLLADYDRVQQECKCGRPRSECGDLDPEHLWYPQLIVCRTQMEAEAVDRLWRDQHKEKSGRVFHDGTRENWREEFSPNFPYRFDDGATVFASPIDLGLGGDFLGTGLTNNDEGGGPDGSPS